MSVKSYAQIDANEEDKPFLTPEDTLQSVVVKRHSPKKAAMLALVAPSAGQIYNKKYWKLPIVYGGLAGLGTWIGFNAKNYKGFTNAYRLEIDNDSTTIGIFKGFTGENQLGVKRDQAKRNLDLSIILLSVGYALQVVDAVVDAHLFEYSITDDLSVKLQPDFRMYQANGGQYKPMIGFDFRLNIKK
ncbi:MAG: DUF5683 domain-containing protein [Chitinophagales bacterium]|nr:DUF5683 domain-containing protein [Chitinophagales bacterium]